MTTLGFFHHITGDTPVYIDYIQNPFIGEVQMWSYMSCTAEICVENDWATIYSVESKEKGNGHCQTLLKCAKYYFEGQGKKFGGTVALNPTMKHIYDKLGIEEYS